MSKYVTVSLDEESSEKLETFSGAFDMQPEEVIEQMVQDVYDNNEHKNTDFLADLLERCQRILTNEEVTVMGVIH